MLTIRLESLIEYVSQRLHLERWDDNPRVEGLEIEDRPEVPHFFRVGKSRRRIKLLASHFHSNLYSPLLQESGHLPQQDICVVSHQRVFFDPVEARRLVDEGDPVTLPYDRGNHGACRKKRPLPLELKKPSSNRDFRTATQNLAQAVMSRTWTWPPCHVQTCPPFPPSLERAGYFCP